MTFFLIFGKKQYCPCSQKCDKQIIDHYTPVSLLPICDKIFEDYNQSGFRSSYSYEYQLLSAVHDIYASFDCCLSLEVRGIFLDISKVFDQVWHEGLIYKLQSLRISGLPLKCIENFLSNRFQRILLNG